MTLAFTLCSINYLAQAHILGNSLKKHAPECRFVIGLVDKIDREGVHPSAFPPFETIEVGKIPIENFDWMNENYDIVELNTAVKPFYMDYLFEKYPEVDKLIYFDPDIVLFQSVTSLEKTLDSHNIVLTPHVFDPFDDGKVINEQDILNHGLYNLGFVALRKNDESKRFVRWWCERLKTQCKHDLCKGLFVDQLWCNFVPIYFNNVHLERSRGYNMAYWNLQERTLQKINNQYFVNKTEELFFFHFSNFDSTIPNNIAQKQTRFDLENRPDLVELYTWYASELERLEDKHLKTFNCDYGKPAPKPKRYLRIRKWISFPFRKMVSLIDQL